MAGHNKWSKIKRQKEKTDAQKSKLFGKLVRLISIETKKSGGLDSPGLRAAMEKARAANVPSENIERAIKRAGETENLESVVYETYGPGGVAIIIEALTSNRNRTVQEIKHMLSENGLMLSNPGSAAWAFEKRTEGWIPKTTVSLEEADGQALSKLLDQLEESDDIQEIFTNAE